MTRQLKWVLGVLIMTILGFAVFANLFAHRHEKLQGKKCRQTQSGTPCTNNTQRCF